MVSQDTSDFANLSLGVLSELAPLYDPTRVPLYLNMPSILLYNRPLKRKTIYTTIIIKNLKRLSKSLGPINLPFTFDFTT